MSEQGPLSAGARAQLRALLLMLVRSTINSVRRRQGAGAMIVLPVLVAFLTIELARFGARSADGMTRVLARVSPARGVHYASFWITELTLALVALKYARTVPGRGSRSLFDTLLLRALPVAPAARAIADVTAASLRSIGVVLLLCAPTVWGLARHAHTRERAVVITVAVCFVLNLTTSLVAVAIHEAWSRRLAGRSLDLMRVVSAVVGVTLLGLFTAVGPLGAGLARTLRTGKIVPTWSTYVPARPLVRWIVGDGTQGAIAWATVLMVAPVVLAVAVFVWRARAPADLSLDAPWSPLGRRRWERSLAPWRSEFRSLLRQAPYLLAAAPAFLIFFTLLGKGARSATDAELPLTVLFGLTGWAAIVMGTALTGAASRRWRRVLWIPCVVGRDPRDAIRAVTVANMIMVAPLALSSLVVLLRIETPEPLWFLRMTLGTLAVLIVGQWTQCAALFLLIDPAPDRLTGLSVASLFGVLAASLPTAALVVMLSSMPLAQWLGVFVLAVLVAWSLEHAATARARWIRDPEGDPDGPRRTWPAARALGLALLAQVMVLEACVSVVGTSPTVALVFGYGLFAAVLMPLSWRAWRAEHLSATWTRPRAVVVGASLGVLNFVSTVAIMRVLRGASSVHASAMAQAIGASSGMWRYALGIVAAFVAPAAEELFFRAWLQHALKRDLSPRMGRWAFVMSAAVFAVLHAGEVQALVFVGGLITGALMERGRRIEAGLAFHSVNNGLAVAAAFGWF